MSRHDVLAEFSRGTVTQYYDTDAMADEIVRLRAIIAALREPSFDVRKAAWREEPDMEAMLRAAVAAAEQEASA